VCGICGIVQFNGNEVNNDLIKKMCKTLVHRGTDDEGTYTTAYIGLGQRRLAVIDLSHKARPPLPNEDCSVWVVSNGEIYNFRELRESLVEQGHSFRSSTDTEVIVHLYEEHGIDCLKHMRGMFAFALWDSGRKRLFAARDRLGKKPFFYTKTRSSFTFGSEIKAITANPTVSSSPNFVAIDSYLSYQYVPSPLTAFSGIYKLPPAHYLLCEVDGTLDIVRYWSPPLSEKKDVSSQEIENELLRQLKESTKLRLISDVPLGAFLSGGIDSGTVVALMAMESSKPVKTFSIGFEEDEFNELRYARLVADRYGTDHHELIVKPDAVEVLPILVRHYNEPFADSSAIPTYYLSKMTREHVTVALSGEGGDENFSGYDHYRQVIRWEDTNVIPWPVRRAFCEKLEALLEMLPYHNFTAKAIRALHMIGSQLPGRYQTQMALLKDQEKRFCYTSYFKSLVNENASTDPLEKMDWHESMDSLDWMMRHDQNFYLPDCLMVKTDIASMANSLEVRCPFLDHEFMEFTATIPSSLKRNSTTGKIILKNAVKGLLPQEILNKPKTGFGIPLGKWFKGDLSDLLKSMLLDDTTIRRNLFEQSALRKMVNEQLSERRDWSNRLWALLFLEMWFREFID